MAPPPKSGEPEIRVGDVLTDVLEYSSDGEDPHPVHYPPGIVGLTRDEGQELVLFFTVRATTYHMRCWILVAALTAGGALGILGGAAIVLGAWLGQG